MGQEGLNIHQTLTHINLPDAPLFLQVTTAYMFYRFLLATIERGEKLLERAEEKRVLCGLEGAKNSHTHLHTQWGYCSTVRELERERESEREHMDGEKRESTEVLKEEEEEAMRTQVHDMM